MQQAPNATGYGIFPFALCCVVGCTGLVQTAPDGKRAGQASGSGGNAVGNGPVDPGRVAIHRLNNTEYDNTVRDLLGTASHPAAEFLAEEGLNFDNTATALGMTTDQYQKYFDAANALIGESLASNSQRARFMACVPSAVADPCARQILGNFGLQIYRRPLEPAEVDRAMKVYDADIARAQTGTEAIGQALRAMLSGASFLYRIEHDDNPGSLTPHPLSGYELASRLSYLTWSSLPYPALFAAAKSDSLKEPAALEATVDRLLADPKATAFAESFAGQWLGLRKLITHSVTPQIFPTYTSTLADAMIAEGNQWFQEFLNRDRPLSDWFTADFNFVNDELAQHYGMAAPGSGAALVRVQVPTDQRRGFLGLASFLTLTSVPSRTSPTARGAWILTAMLCSPPPPPPGNVPKLDAAATAAESSVPSGSENVKARLERHRSDPACAGCHSLLDPIGLGLERFDGIGRYREAYGNGDAIDPGGVLAGAPFAGAQELGELIGQDRRFHDCVASKLYTYALGREIEDYDEASIEKVKAKWSARGVTFRNLMKEVVLSDAFRLRRGEAP